jgi:hypothetical protein
VVVAGPSAAWQLAPEIWSQFKGISFGQKQPTKLKNKNSFK